MTLLLAASLAFKESVCTKRFEAENISAMNVIGCLRNLESTDKCWYILFSILIINKFRDYQ
jgi:hypothetical protein